MCLAPGQLWLAGATIRIRITDWFRGLMALVPAFVRRSEPQAWPSRVRFTIKSYHWHRSSSNFLRDNLDSPAPSGERLPHGSSQLNESRIGNDPARYYLPTLKVDRPLCYNYYARGPARHTATYLVIHVLFLSTLLSNRDKMLGSYVNGLWGERIGMAEAGMNTNHTGGGRISASGQIPSSCNKILNTAQAPEARDINSFFMINPPPAPSRSIIPILNKLSAAVVIQQLISNSIAQCTVRTIWIRVL
ncbi:hypothetical protein FIBSPDRAFT_884078 [Athelia psychrophila]|uniref:Uncharacterized protein n=1 Tax=Athelia psychrophila TaxID=1759441 RepID=A0A166TEJ5_9AGAM|nr:hypothetical protein FIBSPDRAFT_884078 [Fibularhizoctonia sp. CBS 109695]